MSEIKKIQSGNRSGKVSIQTIAVANHKDIARESESDEQQQLHENASSFKSAGAFIMGADFVSAMEFGTFARGILSRRASITTDVS